jgi:hypothetical protein
LKHLPCDFEEPDEYEPLEDEEGDEDDSQPST